MSDAIQAAFRRAGKISPLYRTFQTFRAVLDAKGRPDPGVFDWLNNAPGAIRWKDVDKNDTQPLIGTGEGIVTLIACYEGRRPDLLLDANGAWLAVVSGLEQDSLGVGYRLLVRRWAECDPPRIRNAAP